jgi:hypothetical protein
MARTIPSIKSQTFAGDHPTPGQESGVTPKGDGINEGAVHLQRLAMTLHHAASLFGLARS